MNKTEFILEILDIFRYEDFHDSRIAGLESLRIAEIDYLTKLFGQDRKSALNYFRYILDEALKMEKDIFPQVKQSIQNFHLSIKQPGKSLNFINLSAEKIDLQAEFLNNISDYIAEIIEAGMIYCPKLFKYPEWKELINHVPKHSKIRINLEEELEAKNGRPVELKQGLSYYLIDPEKDKLLLESIINEYQGKETRDMFFLVIVLKKMKILKSDIANIHALLTFEFGKSTMKSRPNFETNYINKYQNINILTEKQRRGYQKSYLEAENKINNIKCNIL
ncbi:MAG: hypothetical protein Q8S54_19875 [Bacteroidota bacterium]|nr:hypothetical protein [Bacteroidota bacterium]